MGTWDERASHEKRERERETTVIMDNGQVKKTEMRNLRSSRYRLYTER